MHFRCVLLALGVLGCSPVMPPPPACTASTCAGCCDSQGRCQDGTSMTACGRLGLTCASCQSGQSCVGGLCQGLALGGGTSGGGDSGGTAGGAGGGGSAGGVSGGGAAGGTTGGGSSGGVVGGGVAGLPRRYNPTAARFAVPSATYGAEQRLGSGRGTSWNTLDLTGDKRVDLVVTSDANGVILMSGTGAVWQVFAGNPTGFSSTASLFPVPGSTANLPIAQTDSAANLQFWNTFDLTGDGFPDFVQTMNASGPFELPFFVGPLTDGWLLRPGSRGGFAAAMTNFSVPVLTNRVDRTFADLTRKRWALGNLTADKIPDLVITADQQTDAVFVTGGVSEWIVCVGSSTGFGELSRCQHVTVPASGSAGGFRSAVSNVPGQGQVWLLTDMDGDGRDDLVQTMNPATIGSTFGVGAGATPFWKVWLSQSSAAPGFSASPVNWSVPAATYATPESNASPQLWSLIDLDGDGVKDLVLTTEINSGRPFMSNGVASWHVHLGLSRHTFSGTAIVWPIPTGPGVDGFRSIRGPTWGVLDLTFDGVPDLVEFADPATNRAFSDAQGAFWKVYAASP